MIGVLDTLLHVQINGYFQKFHGISEFYLVRWLFKKSDLNNNYTVIFIKSVEATFRKSIDFHNSYSRIRTPDLFNK